MELAEVFVCQRCGQCCQGQGGIYFSDDELGPAAAELGLSPREFARRFAVAESPGLWALKSAEDGFCVLYDRSVGGCRIHASKPSMCRAWPFFIGPLRHAEGFAVAKAFCPGIHPEAEWADFLAFHRAFLGDDPPVSYRRALQEGRIAPANLEP